MNSECSKTGWVYFIMWKVSQDLSMLDILYNNFCPHILVRGYYFNSPFTYNLVLFWTFTEHCQAIPCVSEHFAVNSEHIMVWGKVNNISSMAFNKNNITWWTINTLVMRNKNMMLYVHLYQKQKSTQYMYLRFNFLSQNDLWKFKDKLNLHIIACEYISPYSLIPLSHGRQ